MSPATNKHKNSPALLWLSILVDATIVAAIVAKVFRSGLVGLIAWFQQFHLVPVSATNGQTTYRLQPDYRFTVLYFIVIVAAFTLTFFLLRTYLRNRAD